MIYERVNFNEEVVRKMSLDKFTAMHVGVLWQDRDEDTRRKMLSQVHDLIVPKKRKKAEE